MADGVGAARADGRMIGVRSDVRQDFPTPLALLTVGQNRHDSDARRFRQGIGTVRCGGRRDLTRRGDEGRGQVQAVQRRRLFRRHVDRDMGLQ